MTIAMIDICKKYPRAISLAARERATTSPNPTNVMNHLKLAGALDRADWDEAEHILHLAEYVLPLDGVILFSYDYLKSEYNLTPSEAFEVNDALCRAYDNMKWY